MKIAFVFSGQGSQYVGMGKELADNFSICKNVYDKANEILDFNIRNMIFTGEKEILDLTENTQPAILTTSIAINELLKSKGIKPDMVAGLSLGEYSALVASEAISFEEALTLVRKRGKIMQEAVPPGIGKMVAVFGVPLENLTEIVEKASVKGVVEIANINTANQIVIGGEIEAVNYAIEICKASGARRTIELQVSGPFHTSLLNMASVKLLNEINNIEFNEIEIPIISNVTAEVIESKDVIEELLVRQIKSKVKWMQSVEKMIDLGVTVFIEVGPGRVLSSFVRQIDKNVKVYNVEDLKSLNNTLESIGV